MTPRLNPEAPGPAGGGWVPGSRRFEVYKMGIEADIPGYATMTTDQQIEALERHFNLQGGTRGTPPTTASREERHPLATANRIPGRGWISPADPDR